jgi:hypothetical protein
LCEPCVDETSRRPLRLPRRFAACQRDAESPQTGLTLRPELGAVAVRYERRVILAGVPPACHKQRSRAVSSGQPRSIREGGYARRTFPDLGRGSRPKLHGMQGVKALIGLAVPGRPIGPWSRRTGAPEASATGRDRNPEPAHGLLTGLAATGRDGAGQPPLGERRRPK